MSALAPSADSTHTPPAHPSAVRLHARRRDFRSAFDVEVERTPFVSTRYVVVGGPFGDARRRWTVAAEGSELAIVLPEILHRTTFERIYRLESLT